MHEMALCQGLIDLIDDQRASDPFERVKSVVVTIGALGHVDPHALRFAFDVARHGTVAESAELEIEELPGRGWCMTCSESVELAHRGDPCPGCEGFSIIVEQGEELRLKALEVV